MGVGRSGWWLMGLLALPGDGRARRDDQAGDLLGDAARVYLDELFRKKD